MFSSRNRPTEAYSKVGLETGIDIANPHRLILMLFDGAILSLASAGQAMKEKKIEEKGKQISSAIGIISSGLQSSVDPDVGGELSERLIALYDYMCQRLLYANLHNDLAAIEEVSSLLGEIRSAWQEIATHPAVVSGNKVAA
jgi:flagellar protein FliS